MRIPFAIISIAFLLASCKTQQNPDTDKFQILLPDTTKTYRVDKIMDYLINLGKQMNLPKLDTGVTGTKIRLWISSMIVPHHLVTLDITDTSISAKQLDYFFSEDGIVHFKTSHKELAGDSLQLLVKELDDIDFKKMISQSEIPNFDDNVADGVNYKLEIATSKYYKLLIYHCPEHFANSDADNKKFLEIILLLDKHLHFYSPLCD